MEKTKEMLSAPEPDIPRITREMQRLRVGILTYAEVLQNLPDPTLKQEIALLNKMTGGGFEDDPDNDKAKALDAAASRVRSAGIEPESAADLVRGLRALQAIAAQQTRDDQRRATPTG